MRRAIILEHVAHEGPGRLRAILAEHGYAVEERRLFVGDVVPHTLSGDDFLVIMGGPMGVGDIADPRYPFLARECALLQSALVNHVPVLGICLGAQLLAHAAGASVRPNARDGQPVLEVGWKPVDFIGIGQRDELRGLQPQEMMLHWHGDTFGLPPGAIHLASTPDCAQQAFRLPRQVGLQFHCEIDEATVAIWGREDRAFLERANGRHALAQLLQDTTRHINGHTAAGDRLLSNIVSTLSGGSF